MTSKQLEDIVPQHLADLNLQQAKFVVAFCSNGQESYGNAAEASREAGYIDSGGNGIYVTGHRLLRKAKIKDAVKAELAQQAEDLHWTKDSWLMAVSRVALKAETDGAWSSALAALKEIGAHLGFTDGSSDQQLIIQIFDPNVHDDPAANAQVIDNVDTIGDDDA